MLYGALNAIYFFNRTDIRRRKHSKTLVYGGSGAIGTAAIQLAKHFKVPSMVCINKFDLNRDLTRDIEAFAEGEGLSSLGRIPFDPIFIEAMVQGLTIFEYNTGSKAGAAVRQIWQNLSKRLAL